MWQRRGSVAWQHTKAMWACTKYDSSCGGQENPNGYGCDLTTDHASYLPAVKGNMT